MSFQYVDRIFSTKDDEITGLKNVTRNESFFYQPYLEKRFINPAVIIEAGVQLGAWLIMEKTKFQYRPVLLSDEHSEFFRDVVAGEQIDFKITLLDIDDELVAFSGEAWVNGELLLKSSCTRGYLLPMGEFCDAELVKKQFNNLYRPQFSNVSRVQESILLPNPKFNSKSSQICFVDDVLEVEENSKVSCLKNFAASEDFFPTHFPRKPVVPGVIQLTCIGEAAQYLLSEDQRNEFYLHPIAVKNTRFRDFIFPGDQCQIDVKQVGTLNPTAGAELEVLGVIFAHGKKAMMTKMFFRCEKKPQLG